MSGGLRPGTGLPIRPHKITLRPHRHGTKPVVQNALCKGAA